MRLKPAPLISMLGVMATVVVLIVAIYAVLETLPNFQIPIQDSSWIVADLVHIPQFLIPFAVICWITKGRPGEYGFNLRQLPPLFTHGRMLGLGILFGLLMSLRYIPSIVRGVPVEIPQPVNLGSILGNLTFQWVVVGVAEETMFRGLIQTYLTNHLSGHVEMLGHDLHIGTLIGAVFWGMFHFINALVMPIGSVIFYVVLTTAAGLGMGYAYQKTGSLLTTILVHNTMFGVPLSVGYVLYWLQSVS